MEAALVRELDLRIAAEKPDFQQLQSIYFGGGTPSLFHLSGLEALLKRMLPHAPNCREVTLEANPEDVTSERLEAWLEMGINRLSIGLQSFDQNQLDWMNRQHSAEDAAAAVRLAAEAGFCHISADLIYGLPNRTLSFEDELKQFTALPVDHLSAYILTVEDRTVLGRRVEQGAQNVPEDEAVEAEYQQLCHAMAKAGFEHYEVSNWAKPGGHAVHNQHYWSGLPYWGIGPGAHGLMAHAVCQRGQQPKVHSSLGRRIQRGRCAERSGSAHPHRPLQRVLDDRLAHRTRHRVDRPRNRFGLRPDVTEPEAWGVS